MPNQLADFVSAQNTGYETGKGQAQPNAIGLFIRTMLATKQKNLEMQQEYGLKKDLVEEEAKARQKYPSPIESLIAKQLGGGENGSGITNAPASTSEEALKQIPTGDVPEDYITKVETRSVRGIPQTIYRPERKAKVPREDLSLIKDLDVNISDLESNLQFLKDNPQVKEFLGPGLVQRPGAFADIAAQLGASPKDFPTFKAKSDLAFQKYRKWITGVQAGYPELQWIVVDYPKPTDVPEVYLSKANSAIEGMRRNKEIYLDYLSKNNYATGNLKSMRTNQSSTNNSTKAILDETTALEIMREANGDKNEARRIAKERGYQI